MSTATGTITFNDDAVNNATVEIAIFNGNSVNEGTASTATFNNDAVNDGTVNTATFNDNAVNIGETTNASFYGDSVNNGTAQNVTFNDNAVNNGILSGVVYFLGNSVNTAEITGEVYFSPTASNSGSVTGPIAYVLETDTDIIKYSGTLTSGSTIVQDLNSQLWASVTGTFILNGVTYIYATDHLGTITYGVQPTGALTTLQTSEGPVRYAGTLTTNLTIFINSSTNNIRSNLRGTFEQQQGGQTIIYQFLTDNNGVVYFNSISLLPYGTGYYAGVLTSGVTEIYEPTVGAQWSTVYNGATINGLTQINSQKYIWRIGSSNIISLSSTNALTLTSYSYQIYPVGSPFILNIAGTINQTNGFVAAVLNDGNAFIVPGQSIDGYGTFSIGEDEYQIGLADITTATMEYNKKGSLVPTNADAIYDLVHPEGWSLPSNPTTVGFISASGSSYIGLNDRLIAIPQTGLVAQGPGTWLYNIKARYGTQAIATNGVGKVVYVKPGIQDYNGNWLFWDEGELTNGKYVYDLYGGSIYDTYGLIPGIGCYATDPQYGFINLTIANQTTDNQYVILTREDGFYTKALNAATGEPAANLTNYAVTNPNPNTGAPAVINTDANGNVTYVDLVLMTTPHLANANYYRPSDSFNTGTKLYLSDMSAAVSLYAVVTDSLLGGYYLIATDSDGVISSITNLNGEIELYVSGALYGWAYYEGALTSGATVFVDYYGTPYADLAGTFDSYTFTTDSNGVVTFE